MQPLGIGEAEAMDALCDVGLGQEGRVQNLAINIPKTPESPGSSQFRAGAG